MSYAAYLKLPIPIISIIGWEDTAAVSGGIALVLPPPSPLAMGGIPSSPDRTGNVQLQLPTPAINGAISISDRAKCLIEFPTPTVAITGLVSQLVGINLATPAFSVNISGTVSNLVNVAISIPALTVSITEGYSAVTLELPAVEVLGSGSVGTIINTKFSLPHLDIDALGNTGISGAVTLVTTVPQIRINSANEIRISLHTPILATSGYVGTIGFVSSISPHPIVSIGGEVPYIGNVALTTRNIISSAGIVGVAGNVELSLRKLALAAVGRSGVIGTATITLPVFSQVVAGHEEYIANVTLAIPTLILTSNIRNVAGTISNTIVMHTETQAVSTYTNYGFNSYANFNGVYLAANDIGVFALTGTNDDGVIIEASARAGITDFGSSHLKRVDRMYVGYRASGGMVLRVFTDEINTREYLLSHTGKTGIHGNHVRIGKGLAARYWQFEIGNKNGASFELNIVEVKPTILRRRIGNNDA